jgi:hypothetical protein
MHRTYELYVRRPNGHVQFQALTFRGSEADVMRHVEGLLSECGAEAIEVRRGGEHLFTLGSDISPT